MEELKKREEMTFSTPYQVGVGIIIAEAIWALYWFVCVWCQVFLVPENAEGFEYHTELAFLLFHTLCASTVWTVIEHRREPPERREFGPLIFMVIALLSDIRSILVVTVRLPNHIQWAWNLTLAGACVAAALSTISIGWYIYIMNHNRKPQRVAKRRQ